MTTALVAPTELQPKANAKPFDAWKRKGEGLFRRHQDALAAHETSQWDVGDWLVEGEDDFGKKAYEAAEEVTGWKRGTLYNVVFVVRRFPANSSLRSETRLKWSHFKELARIPQKYEHLREQILGEFGDGFECTVESVRQRVDAELEKLKDSEDREKPKKEHKRNKFVMVEVPVTRKFGADIRSLAKANEMATTELLQDFFEKYFPKYKKQIEAAMRHAKVTSNR
jgi:hypothetical protein